MVACSHRTVGSRQRHLLAAPAAPALSMVTSCLPLAPGCHTGVTLHTCADSSGGGQCKGWAACMQTQGPASALHTFSAALWRPYLVSIAIVSTRGSLIVAASCVARAAFAPNAMCVRCVRVVSGCFGLLRFARCRAFSHARRRNARHIRKNLGHDIHSLTAQKDQAQHQLLHWRTCAAHPAILTLMPSSLASPTPKLACTCILPAAVATIGSSIKQQPLQAGKGTGW